MPASDKEMSDKGINALNVFSYVGGALIFLGIAAFISLNWDSLSSANKIISTLGSGIAAYVIGVLLILDKKFPRLSSAFFLIAGLVLPIGISVTYAIMKWNTACFEMELAGVCLLLFFISQIFSPRTIFLLFTILFATFFFVAIIDYLTSSYWNNFSHLFEYEALTVGLSYICLGYYLNQDKVYPLAGPLYFFGALLVLIATFSLADPFFDHGKMYWKMVHLGLILLGYVLAIPLKSKSFLYLSSIFLVVFILIESYRFADIFGNFGWPLLLIISGFMIMILGYVIFNLHKKINSKKIS